MFQGTQLENKCADHTDFGYFCVPYYQCDAQNKIITDGIGLVDPRTGDDECPEGIYIQLINLVILSIDFQKGI